MYCITGWKMFTIYGQSLNDSIIQIYYITILLHNCLVLYIHNTKYLCVICGILSELHPIPNLFINKNGLVHYKLFRMDKQNNENAMT